MSITAMKQALEALELALRCHGVMLLSDPPKDAWKYHGVEADANKAITALRTAIAEAEKQEPVAWQATADKCQIQTVPAKGGLLPTTPPAAQRQWVGLTDEEILSDDTLRYYYGMNGGAGPVSQKGKKVVAAIEEKLKEKNNG